MLGEIGDVGCALSDKVGGGEPWRASHHSIKKRTQES
jgi:hypothetical protein